VFDLVIILLLQLFPCFPFVVIFIDETGKHQDRTLVRVSVK